MKQDKGIFGGRIHGHCKLFLLSGILTIGLALSLITCMKEAAKTSPYELNFNISLD